MMTITQASWNKYIRQLSAMNKLAGAKMAEYISQVGIENTNLLIDYAFALVSKYGEGSAELAARMYDELTAASGMVLPAAEPAAVSTMEDVAKAINANRSSAPMMQRAVSRMVKQAGADTTLQNAIRDGAQFAWVPSGDTCAFCITLASRGWQRAGKKALKGGHAEHIHANCDCTYAIRFNTDTRVEGYDPERYLEQYESAEGNTPQEKMNAMRRAKDAEKRALEAAGTKKITVGSSTSGPKNGRIPTRSTSGFSAAISDSEIQELVSIDRQNVLQAAKEGQAHRHGGVHRDAVKKSKKELQKSIVSRTEQVRLHADKIAHPEKYVESWNEMSPEAQTGLIRKWQKDMRRNAEQTEIELGVYEERFGNERADDERSD